MNTDIYENLKRTAWKRAMAEHERRCEELSIPAGTTGCIVAVFTELSEYVQDLIRHQKPSAYVTITWLRYQAAQWRHQAALHHHAGEMNLVRIAQLYAEQLTDAADRAERQESHHATA